MKNIVLQGPVLTQSGYGVHARQIAKWLLERPETNVKFVATVWGDCPWIVDHSAYDGLAGEVIKRLVSPDAVSGFDASFQLQLPNEWNPKLSKKNIGVTAAVETDRANPSWSASCDAMDAVIVPSLHSRASLMNSGRKPEKPIHVIPESFAPEVAIEHKLDLEFSTSFNFLIFGQITGMNANVDRKNTFYAIKWLCEAFKDDPDVGIVIKTNLGRNSLIDRAVVTNMIKQLLSEVRKGPYPKLHLVHGDMNDKEVSGLYHHESIKALVTLTRGEGYGLPILEAAAAGLPIIATNWSGHLDFLKHGKFIGVHYQLGEVDRSKIDGQIFMPGARWANPSEQDFKKRAAKFRTSPDVPREWALALSQKIKEKYDLTSIIPQYEQVLSGVVGST